MISSCFVFLCLLSPIVYMAVFSKWDVNSYTLYLAAIMCTFFGGGCCYSALHMSTSDTKLTEDYRVRWVDEKGRMVRVETNTRCTAEGFGCVLLFLLAFLSFFFWIWTSDGKRL